MFCGALLLSALVFGGALMQGMTPWGDSSQLLFPVRAYIGSQILEGSFPWWNPFLGIGLPLVTIPQSGIFYPSTLLYALFSPRTAQGVELLLHLALALTFTFLYCRRLGLSTLAAILGGIIFSMSGFIMVHWATAPLINALPWLPAACLCFESFRQQRQLRGVVGTGLALGLALLSGHISVAVTFFIALALYGLFIAAAERSWSLAGGTGLAILLGVGFGGVLLFPLFAQSAELVEHSQPGISLSSQMLLGVISPRRGLDIFIGIVPLILGVLAAAKIRELPRAAWGWLQVAAVALVLMLGDYTPLYATLSRVPLGGELAGIGDALFLILPLAVFFLLIARIRHHLNTIVFIVVGGGLFAVFMLVHLSFFEALYPLAASVPLFGATHEPWAFVVPLSFSLAILSGAVVDLIPGRWTPRLVSVLPWLRCYGVWCLALLLIGGAIIYRADREPCECVQLPGEMQGAGDALQGQGKEECSPGNTRRPVVEATLMICFILAIGVLARWPRLAIALLICLHLADSYTYTRAVENDKLSVDPKAAALAQKKLLPHVRPASRLWIEGSPRDRALVYALGGIWPNAPAAWALGSLPVWGTVQPAALAQLLGKQPLGQQTALDDLEWHRNLSLLGVDLLVLSAKSWERIGHLRGKRRDATVVHLARIPPLEVKPPLAGDGTEQSPTHPPDAARAGKGLKLRALPGSVAVEEQHIDLLPYRFYQIVLSVAAPWGSADGGVHCDLFAEGYDNNEQQLDILPRDIGRQTAQFSKIIFSGAAPAKGLFRVISSSATPLLVQSATLALWTPIIGGDGGEDGHFTGDIYQLLNRLDDKKVLVRNLAAFPRVWMAEKAIDTPDLEEVPRKRQDIIDLRQEVVVEQIGRDRTFSSGKAQWLPSSASDLIAATVTTPGDGLVVFNELFAIGWSAAVNNRPARILRAHGLFMAVEVSPGESKIVLRYTPQGLGAGVNRACASLFLCLIFLGYGYLRGRFPRQPGRSCDLEEAEPLSSPGAT